MHKPVVVAAVAVVDTVAAALTVPELEYGLEYGLVALARKVAALVVAPVVTMVAAVVQIDPVKADPLKAGLVPGGRLDHPGHPA